ncbi:unnamed protein product [Diatraea saccharalis]|uniref:Enoyl reductase (ER) domain-containing protein n=1 Tax=Diatraea saccharalis TaxID=40085 RepID=A0A9N9R7G4_9NEOP|nr:unnamed protein product [Diatraea saccharalis]
MPDNYAAVLYGPNDVRIEKWPMPEINNDELLIEISCVGICGSDVKLYMTGRCGLEELVEPMVIGHEGAGIVAKVGSNVVGFCVGDRVAIEPTQPCGACEHCKRGEYNLCVRPRYCATTTGTGNLCTYYKHRADFCHKLPDNLSMEEGAAVQPLAIAVHACRRARITLGARLVILGAGPIGVLCAITARAMGATQILITVAQRHLGGKRITTKPKDRFLQIAARRQLNVTAMQLIQRLQSEHQLLVSDQTVRRLHEANLHARRPLRTSGLRRANRGRRLQWAREHLRWEDVVESRLETAKKMGADYTLLIRPEFSEQDVADKIMATLGSPPDVTIEACGYSSTQAVAMMVTRPGGTVVVVGIGPERVQVPLAAALLREVDVRGSYRIANTYPAALAAVSRGTVDLSPFITHHFPLNKIKEAIELAKTGAAMKIIIHVKP